LSANPTANQYISSLETLAPTFAPSPTIDFLRCPALWDQSRRWRKREPWVPHLAAGHAIHAGMASALSGSETDPQQVALDTLASAWPSADTGEWTLEGVSTLVRKGLAKGLKTDLLEGGNVVAVEACLDHLSCATPTPGACAITDLVTRDAAGNLGITDHKSKLALDARWVEKELRRAEHSWQLFDYARRATLYFQEPVTWARIHLIICGPSARALTVRVEISEARMLRWFYSACQVWHRMAEGETSQNFTACGDYGGCDFYDLCHTLAGDETKAEALFIPKGLPS
jgi:hypothetical protein